VSTTAQLLAELAVVSLRRAGGPVVVPRTSRCPDILPWRATSRRCPSRTGAFASWRIDRVVAVVSSHLVTGYFGDDGTCTSEFSSCTSSWIGLGASMLVHRGSSHIWVVEALTFIAWSFPRRECVCEGQVARAALLCGSAVFTRLEGCHDGISHLLYYTRL